MPPRANAVWTTQDEHKLLELLLERKASAGDGGNFKEAVFQEVSDILTPLVTKGGPKTVKACQNKWLLLRKTFRVVTAIKNVSGWTWSDVTGASITPESESSWAAYVKIHKEAKPFKNHGWCHLDLMSQVMPSLVHGAHIFRPSNSSVGLGPANDDDEACATPVDTPSPPLDHQDMSVPVDDPSGTTQSLASESDDEGIDVTQVVIMTPRRSKKRSAAAPPSSAAPSSSKRGRTTGATAIEGLALSLGHFGDVIAKALAPVPSDAAVNASRRQDAILRAQVLEKWLTIHELLAFVNLLEKDTDAVAVYLARRVPQGLDSEQG
ncbi:hypothetical protein LshimejAT787_0700350 [Lyophyllum shimeji]|uniref:Myb/SANT-like DNA-binding domain-containing protein n=1 Tax=Lyophyllum shimeji TaxID=47721 RepID=A0A9P3PN90_LYOSH|nr:hypothetical protein LshimejAT787_0700350 [Lyophyllum shimeji]